METVKQIHVGNTIVGGNGSLFVMAGPCVIEDPERTLNIGRKMKEICERLGLPYILKPLLTRPIVRHIRRIAARALQKACVF